MNIKEELLVECKKYVNHRLQTIQETISSNQKALLSETKSSAGDKHETGRAMLQLEMEKAGQQLQNIELMQTVLEKIDTSKESSIVRLGSIIETEKVNYFLSISAGKISACGKPYFAVSTASPVGKQLLGKKENDVIKFNGLDICLQIVK